MSIFKKSNTIEEAVETQKRKIHNLIVLDTSALIDGRIVELAESGFIESTFVVASFVLDELQMLADGKDSMKRERGRYGLDMVRKLKECKFVDVRLSRREYPEVSTVDSKLVALSIDIEAKLCTNDYNLNKVADIQDVVVLNINDLTKSLRTVSLPGEHKEITIVQKGSERKQGVGYLDDGTMIVVEDGQKYMKKNVTVEVEKMLQTEAGKMVFATIVSKPKNGRKPSQKNSSARPKKNTSPRKPAKASPRKSSTKTSSKNNAPSKQSNRAKQSQKKRPKRLGYKERLEEKLLDTIANQ